MAVALLLAAGTLWFLAQRPSHDRDWLPEQAVLPYAAIDGKRVTLHHIRNFTFHARNEFSADYYDRTFDLDDIRRAYFIVEPFAGEKVGAHTMLSFEFEGDQFMVLSVEARRPVGVGYSAWKGALRQYELMYVLADERDVLRLRANLRGNPVFLYPLAAGPELLRSLFVSIVRRANELREQPAFYNTLTDNCATTLVRHMNEVSDQWIGWSQPLLFTEKSDELAWRLGLLDVGEADDFETIRDRHRINALALEHEHDPDFSLRIRGR